jgi:hypothetical protein
LRRYEATLVGWILTGPTTALEDTMRAPVPARLLLLALLCLAAAACGGSGDDAPSAAPATTTTVAASGTTAAASAACADAAALKASLAELDQLDPAQAGKAGTVAALQQVRDDLTKLKASGGSEWGDQVTELDAAVNAFQATISGISGDSLVSDLPTILSDLGRIDTAWKALDQQITQTCG